MKQRRQTTQLNLFDATLNEILKHYTDAVWLGQKASLATPYFLGHFLQGSRNPNSSLGRGRALQAAVGEAADALWPGTSPQTQQGLLTAVANERSEQGNEGPRYLYLLLELRYLRRFFPPSTPPNQVSAMPDFLGVSKSRFFEHLKTAREALAVALLNLMRPGLRLEQPIHSGPLIGRGQLLRQCLTYLQDGQSITLTGVGGVGKTSLASTIAQKWPTANVFWFTFRPGLNDDLDSLIFTLAHFLSRRDCTNLWLQLNANEGKINSLEQALGFLREDIKCARQVPLLCFDEIDLLYTASDKLRHINHGQLIEFLRSLCTLTPLLLIGQRALVDTDLHYILPPLTLAHTEVLLKESGMSDLVTADQLHGLTEGNPRLIELYLALYKSSGGEAALRLTKSPAIQPIFHRLWRRLSQDEKRILATLSAFRTAAPYDAWQKNRGYRDLQERHLLKFDTGGGVSLLPIFRQLIYEALLPAQRHAAHQQAAVLRNQHGQYTEAAYHLWLAEQYPLAVNLWFTYQSHEISQGKAAAAHAIFCEREVVELDEHVSHKLALIQNRLNLLFGEAEEVLIRMNNLEWNPQEQTSAGAFQQWGEAHLIKGETEEALSQYDKAIQVLSGVSSQLVLLHQKRAKMFIEHAATDAARKEIQRAQYEVEHLKGLVEMAQGQFLQAQSHLETAIQIAQSINDESSRAKSNHLFAIAAGNYGDLSLAHKHAEEAMTYYQTVGNRLQVEGLRAELAGFYLNCGRYADVIEPAEKALAFFENIQHGLWIGYLCSNLAEAYFETGDINRGEAYAHRALQAKNPRVHPYALYTLGLIYQAKQEMDQAEQFFQRGLICAGQAEDRFIAAYLHRAFGQMLLESSSNERGNNELHEALTIFTDLSMEHEVARTQALLEM